MTHVKCSLQRARLLQIKWGLYLEAIFSEDAFKVQLAEGSAEVGTVLQAKAGPARAAPCRAGRMEVPGSLLVW